MNRHTVITAGFVIRFKKLVIPSRDGKTQMYCKFYSESINHVFENKLQVVFKLAHQHSRLEHITLSLVTVAETSLYG